MLNCVKCVVYSILYKQRNAWKWHLERWVIFSVTLNYCIWQVQGLTTVLEHSQDVVMPKGVILWFYTIPRLSIIHVIALNFVNENVGPEMLVSRQSKACLGSSLPSTLKTRARIKVFLSNEVDYGKLITLVGAIDTSLKSRCGFLPQTCPTVSLRSSVFWLYSSVSQPYLPDTHFLQCSLCLSCWITHRGDLF